MEEIKPNLLIAKKTEKLVTAVYLISQFLEDKEGIKFELRNTANQLLKSVNLFAYSTPENIYTLYKNSLDQVSLIILYLSLAKNTKLISEMNCDIVIEALRGLENILVNQQFNFDKQNITILEEDFFFNLSRDIQANNFVNQNTSFDVLTKRSLNKNSLPNFSNNSNFNKTIPSPNYRESLNDNLADKRQNTINDISKKISETKSIPNQKINAKPKLKIESKTQAVNIKKKVIPNKLVKKNSNRKQNRREQILNVFSPGVEVSINDISKKIIGCSIKTIQREINNLLEEEKIAKIGEKR